LLRERLGALLTLALAVGLLVLAVPRLGASLAKLPGDPGIDLLNEGQFLAPDTLGRVLSSRQAAERWLDEPSTEYELGLTFYGASRQTVDPISRARFLLEAVKDFRASVRKSPADPYAWAYLALAYTDLGDQANGVAMLEASYDFGPFMPEIAMMRSYVAIRSWASLDQFARLLAGDDFVQAMTRQPTAFVQLAVTSKFEKEARQALAATPDLLVQFEKMASAAEQGA
jgi:tetratricopeptide (TPR) repeat protein